MKFRFAGEYICRTRATLATLVSTFNVGDHIGKDSWPA
jgi:hypothetical protein